MNALAVAALLLAGSAETQLHTCPKGTQYSIEAAENAAGLPVRRFYVEPGHRLVVVYSPVQATLLDGERRRISPDELLQQYPGPCDYIERPRASQ